MDLEKLYNINPIEIKLPLYLTRAVHFIQPVSIFVCSIRQQTNFMLKRLIDS